MQNRVFNIDNTNLWGFGMTSSVFLCFFITILGLYALFILRAILIHVLFPTQARFYGVCRP